MAAKRQSKLDWMDLLWLLFLLGLALLPPVAEVHKQIILLAIGFLQLFPEPYVMTRGGPVNATLSVVMLMYEQGFRWWNMGYAAAVAFILFLFIGAATLLQLKAQRARS